MSSEGGGKSAPQIPDGLMEELSVELQGEDAPFASSMERDLELKWSEEGESRLGFTRFECDHNEIYRRRRLGVPPGPVTIALNPILKDDTALFRHTLAVSYTHLTLPTILRV